MPNSAIFWIVFNLVVVAILVVDLAVLNRRPHEVRFREALIWTGALVALALLFDLGIYVWRGHRAALEFLTGYLLEYSLSVDNLFVFILLFNYFRVPPRYQHRVLFWGILGALVMRAVFILTGIALIQRFHWVMYLFGLLLIVSGVKLAFEKDKEVHPERNLVLRLFRRLVPITHDYEGSRFFLVREGRFFATPLLVVLIVVETTDVLFAVDSIPAILAITRDVFIVYTSNVFAILGLRSLYFVIAGVMKLFHHLHYGLSAILVFVGAKMLLDRWVEVPVHVSLPVIATLIGLSIMASLIWPKKEERAEEPPAPATNA